MAKLPGMNIRKIRKMVAAGESESLEFKATAGARREAAKTVCAMLNHRGGHVLIGVSPDCQLAGQEVSGRTVERIADELRRIEPAAFPKVTRVSVNDRREIIVIAIGEGKAKPYQYRGTAYRRLGNISTTMPAEEYQRVLIERFHSDERWEKQPAEGWGVDDLEVAEIRNTIGEAIRIGRLNEPGSREPAALLTGLGLMRAGIPLRAAAVLFGKSERLEVEMPQCRLRVARFRGLDRSDFLDNRQFHGNAFTLLANAQRFLHDTLPIASRFESGRMRRIDEPLYPPLATREALANALCHRDYSMSGGSIGLAVYDDRLEVTSPGPLHFGLTPEDLFGPHESKPWNPLVARTFYRRGIIEEWGRGTLRMAELTAGAGMPAPEIDDAGGFVTVRFRFRAPMSRIRATVRSQENEVSALKKGAAEICDIYELGEHGLLEVQRAVLELLKNGRTPLALRDIRSELPNSYSERQIRRALYRLRDLRLAACLGRGATAGWRPRMPPQDD